MLVFSILVGFSYSFLGTIMQESRKFDDMSWFASEKLEKKMFLYICMYISITDARLSKETNYLPELREVVIYYIYQEDRGVSWLIFY